MSPVLSSGSKDAEILPRTGSCRRRTVVAADGNRLVGQSRPNTCRFCSRDAPLIAIKPSCRSIKTHHKSMQAALELLLVDVASWSSSSHAISVNAL